MKYLVIKGWLGFGDRLESLIMGIKFAIDNKLTVYVDWKDEMWSHNGEDFYTYFKLVNIPQIKSLDEIPEDATIHPPFWKGRLHEQISYDLLKDSKDIDLGILHGTYPGDVIVCPNTGPRSIFGYPDFFANVFRVSDNRILTKLKERNRILNLSNAVGVHIRGSDRLHNENKRNLSIQWLATSAFTFLGKPMIIVSDDKESIAIWKRFFPDSKVVSELSLQQSSSGGNHNLKKDQTIVCKDELNVDMLVDFFTLASTQKILKTHKDSRFGNMAIRLQPYVKTILSL